MNESSILKEKINFEVKPVIEQISKNFYSFVKRLFDIFASLFGLIFLSPIFIITIILIKKEDCGFAILTQERIGKNGNIFKLYKFRSMTIDADEVLKEMLKDPIIEKEYKKI